MGNGIGGEFTGFRFNGKHTVDLGITRVSGGNRYNENILPTIQDKTVQVPGADGTYYFGSYYTQRPWNLNLAYDGVTETQRREIIKTFGTKDLCELIFDEYPDRYYMAKVNGTPQMKFIPMDASHAADLNTIDTNQESHGIEDNVGTGLIYKGEMTINFVAYYPFAKSTATYKASTPNKGDLPTDFVYEVPFSGDAISAITLSASDGSGQLYINKIKKKGNDYGVRISSRTNLIEGIGSDGAATGNLYNEYIARGSFFKIPVNAALSGGNGATMQYIYY